MSTRADGGKVGKVADGTLGTLVNGIRIVELLAARPATVREMADALGMANQTTYRLVRTLISVGWVCRESARDRYRLTASVWALGTLSYEQTELRDIVADSVVRLAADLGETVHLSTYEAGRVIYIDKADGSQPIRSYTRLGGQAPAYCVATGKALLAHQPVAEQARVLGGELVAHSPRTITDPGALAAELDQVRHQGFAVNRGEWRAEVGGVAVALRSPRGDVPAALGFSGPVDRILARQDELVTALDDELQRIGMGNAQERARPR